MRVLIVGCGYVGLPLGAELVRQGHEVFGLRRNPAAANELEAAGIKPLFADITQPGDLAKLPRDFDWVVNCAASGGGGAAGYRELYLTGNRNLIEWLQAAPPRRYVYTSSTSVYGQNDGSIVMETDPVAPESETGKILVMTEKLLLAAATEIKFPAVILRLAGIYGPGRGYWLKQFLSGEARIEGDGSRLLNMIHRDDAAGAIIAALKYSLVGQAGLTHTESNDIHQGICSLSSPEGAEGRGEEASLFRVQIPSPQPSPRLGGEREFAACISHSRGYASALVGQVFNVVDNEPVSQLDMFQWLAEKTGRPLPPVAPADTESNRRRGVTNKRVSNQRLKKLLGYEFKYPTFRQGYTAEIQRLKPEL